MIDAATRYLSRRAAMQVAEALSDTRVVLVNGARQSGKSTLVKKIGQATGATWYSLDDADTRDAARRDPASFVRLSEKMIVDEIQRDPELLLSIKSLVDEVPSPGRFLLTGSARVLGLRDLPDTLIGRMETIELWPLSQGEIEGNAERFIDLAFECGPELRHDSLVDRDDYIERVVRGGFPDAFRREPTRRARYLTQYVADLVNRDVVQLAEIERGPEMRALITVLAGCTGQTVSASSLSRLVGLRQETTARYLSLLEEVYLIKRIPAWTRRISGRSVSQSKISLVDSGVAAALLTQTFAKLRRPGGPLGPLFEGFVAMEIARQIQWSQEQPTLSHYRTRDGVEVDLILENGMGQVIGIEVKATSSPSTDDFRGLRHLAERLGDDLIAGYVLHTGPRTLPFGDKLRAIPASALWELTVHD
ncbi:MAG: ATP-binding protein [Promicromonosporaceae bacterium]|nr:ATP-binding protein [Promicromonosporaceae bacterium]